MSKKNKKRVFIMEKAFVHNRFTIFNNFFLSFQVLLPLPTKFRTKMHRFLKGVTPPPAKKTKTDQNKKYEEKRVRTVNPKWLNEFTWLKAEGDGKMICSVCISAKISPSATSFIQGNSVFKLETVKKHAKSSTHLRAQEIVLAKAKAAEDSQGMAALKSMRNVEEEKMQPLFLTAHAMALKGRPFTDFPWICEVDIKKGVSLPSMYKTDKYCRILTKYIAEVERKKMVINLEASFIRYPWVEGW